MLLRTLAVILLALALARPALLNSLIDLYMQHSPSLLAAVETAAANKLPSYILPLIPAVAALLGIALAEARDAGAWLAACAVLLIAFPVAAQVLPVAAATGLSRAPLPHFQWTWLLPLAMAALVWTLDRRGRRGAAVLAIVTGATLGTVLMKNAAAPDLDRLASARTLHAELGARQESVCVDWVPRGMQYSLEYYFVPPLPECSQRSRPVWLHQLAGQLPALAPPKPGH